MAAANYYTTIGDAWNFIVNSHQKAGRDFTFPTVLENMRQNGLLLSKPPAIPLFYPNMSQDAFREFIFAMPIPADSILEQRGAFQNNSTIPESGMFPMGKDVFCILNMPYMVRQLYFRNFFDVCYVVEGNCTFLFEGERASLHKGDVCIVSPMAGHDLPLDSKCISLSFVVRKSTFNTLFGNLLTKQDLVSMFFRNSLYQPRRANYILLRTGNDQELYATAQELFCECNRTDDYSNACGVGLLNLFLARSLRAAAGITLRHYENYSGRDFNFALILQYIQQNYRTVTLSSLADTFHFSKTYLSKLIHKNMGYSFTDMMRSVKMAHAMDYLTNTSMKVSEISDAVGYDSVDHFSRTFRREYGVSPQQYRQMHNAGFHVERNP